MKRLLKRRQFTRMPNPFNGGGFTKQDWENARMETGFAFDELRDSLISGRQRNQEIFDEFSRSLTDIQKEQFDELKKYVEKWGHF